MQSSSVDHAMDVAAQIRSGNVHINGSGPDFGAPFGGYKQSGIGRDNGYQALENYLQVKSTWIKIS